MATEAMSQLETNQRCLTALLAELRAILERHAAGKEKGEQAGTRDAIARVPDPPQLEILAGAFGLSRFERAILLLCAAIELDSTFASLCTLAQGDPARPYPTFSLALAALDEPHWSALNPAAPLRRWRLIEVQNHSGTPLTTSPLRIDERILHFLAGVHYQDERLAGFIHPVHASEELVPSYAALAHTIASIWNRADPPLPLIQLCGADEASRQTIAAASCAEAGLRLYTLAGDQVPGIAPELENLIRLWERESVLNSGALYVETDAIDRDDLRAAGQISRLLELLHGPVFLSARERWRALRRTIKTLDVRKPTADEQGRVWHSLLGGVSASINGHVAHLVSQFNLTVPAIHASVAEALETQPSENDLMSALWDAGRAQARPRLDDLAESIEAKADWDSLVLPEAEKSMLRTIVAHVRNRATVYGTWGFGAVSSRGLGIGALFAGASGTGKTMAAEVLANELKLDLYRIDLSCVVSKYIGETEKNLRRVFDAAEDGGVVLFFDEADALFGKRSEVKDSHDRYANIEINYLLQRMESYRGLAVLATNMKSALDPAFMRRIRFIVSFPFPEVPQRAEIWRRVFPSGTPTENLDHDKLARLGVAGGNIRNIALNAAFMAAEAGEPVRMAHLARAARYEFAKIEKPLSEAEIAGWA
jgi:AAA+ superfamily predicted ATPase